MKTTKLNKAAKLLKSFDDQLVRMIKEDLLKSKSKNYQIIGMIK